MSKVTGVKRLGQAFLLGGALGVATLAACGGGLDLRLGGATESSDSSIDAGGALDASDGLVEERRDASDSASSDSGCPSGTEIDAPILAFLDDDLFGFGSASTGGRDGCLYRVTSTEDSLVPGTLRYGVEQSGRLWIVFDVGPDPSIELQSNLKARSNKTIDGRGLNVTLKNFGIEITNQENFVFANLSFVGRRELETEYCKDSKCRDSLDAISLMGEGTRHVWIHHCTFSNYHDDLTSVTAGATDLTISWSRFREQDFVMLLGNENDEPAALRAMRVTLHHNWFENTNQYHPRVRYGQVHMYNNFLDRWRGAGVAATQDSQVYSYRNIYFADEKPVAIENYAGGMMSLTGNVVSNEDQFLGGARFGDLPGNDPLKVFKPTNYPFDATGPALQKAIEDGAGNR